MSNKVFIATSLDGYIAKKDGGLDWLPSPDSVKDSGFEEFMKTIDALIMGRNTFETVLSFEGEWFYTKPVFVVSSSLKSIPEYLVGKVEIIDASPKEILTTLNQKGYKNLYIDGAKTIQNFLQEDLIDEMVITTIPVLLGDGISLFGKLDQMIKFECIESKIIGSSLTQSHYIKC